MNQERTEDMRGLKLEALPDHVVASIEVRDAWRQAVVDSGEGLEFLVARMDGWKSGATVRVAFLGGTTELHRKIADATKQITDACNIVLDFGEAPAGTFRRWSTSDVQASGGVSASVASQARSGRFSATPGAPWRRASG